MKRIKFESYPFQPCIFIWQSDEKLKIILKYVDDLLVATNCKHKLNETVKELMREFEITILSKPKRFLGLEIERYREKKILLIKKKEFIRTILRRFGIKSAKNNRFTHEFK